MDDSRRRSMEAGRQRLRLIEARSEFAEARAARSLRLLAEEAATLRQRASGSRSLDGLALRSRLLLEMETSIQDDRPPEVDVSKALGLWATRAALASPIIVDLRSVVDCILVPGHVCGWLMAVSAELVHAVEASGDTERGLQVEIGLQRLDGEGLVLRVAARDLHLRPVSKRSGLAALERAGRVMRLLGSLRSSVEPGEIVHVATFRGKFEDVA